MQKEKCINRREKERILFPFPVYLANGEVGETIDLSETGLCVGLERSISNSQILSIEIEFPFSGKRIRVFGRTIWKSFSKKDNKHIVGLRIINPKDEDVKIIKEAISKKVSINDKVVQMTTDIRAYLLNVKKSCDVVDQNGAEEIEQIEFIKEKKKQVYPYITEHIKNLYKIFQSFNQDEYSIHRKYYQIMLSNILLDNIEVNRHARCQPFGYAGDFMLINYYYDFYDKFLGRSTFEKLINYYSLNLFISISVVKRKEFFKKKLQEVINKSKNTKILSVGSGSARELIELLRERSIKNSFSFDCLDFEKEAVACVKKDLEAIDDDGKKLLNISYINKSLIEVVKQGVSGLNKKYDLVYSSGLFDYLTDRIAEKMLRNLFGLVKEGGELIITNASHENSYERMYYEMLGEWELIYRNPDNLLSWTKLLHDIKEKTVLDIGEKNAFLFLRLKK
jgi:2-polyprenyl-3-methyl-5-hydroxy-6-metoxy-1,4-benzoquinol methylase